jgi:hypothetical protein
MLNLICFLILCGFGIGQKSCVKWGNTFDVSLESKNVHRNCFREGKPICCAAVANVTTLESETRGVGFSFVPTSLSFPKHARSKESKVSCVVSKVYISSPLEMRDLEMAKTIDNKYKSDELDNRLNALLSYVTSPETVTNSTRWLERVRLHMSSEEAPTFSSDDSEFLSRFVFTRDCSGEVDEWTEWIEPISITARHPFGFSKCKNTGKYFTKDKPRVGRSDVDYVLLQSGHSLYNQTHTSSGRRIGSIVGGKSNTKKSRSAKHYLLDAGTSTFDSSLFWFTCGYSQVRLATLPNLGF